MVILEIEEYVILVKMKEHAYIFFSFVFGKLITFKIVHGYQWLNVYIL